MGRKLGSRNKVGASAKENVIAVFTRLGGTAAMAEWAKANQSEFYKLYARLIPQQVNAEVSHTLVRTISEGELADAFREVQADSSGTSVQ